MELGRAVNLMERAFQALKFVVMAPYESEISAEIDFEPGVILSKMADVARARSSDRRKCVIVACGGDGVRRLFGTIEASRRVVRSFRSSRSHLAETRVVQSVNCRAPGGNVLCDNGPDIA